MAIPAFRFDIDAVAKRMTDLREGGFSSSQHEGAGRDVKALRRAEQRKAHQEMNIEYSEKMRQELKAKAILELPNGCDPVRVDDPTSDLHGEYVCITCRHNKQRAKHRAKTTDYGGGPMSLLSIIEGDEAKRAEKEKKEQEDQEERERKSRLRRRRWQRQQRSETVSCSPESESLR